MRSIRILAVCLALRAVPAAAALDITTCGQIIPSGQAAQLVADLACASGAGVVLGHRSRLYLDGHVLSGSPDTANVVCQGPRCKIVGPGELVGGYFAVAGEGQLNISEVTVRDQIRGGIDGLTPVRVRRVTMTGIGFGHPTPSASEVIRGGKLYGAYLEARDNAGGISVIDYRLRHATITNNGGIGIGVRVVSSLELDGDREPRWPALHADRRLRLEPPRLTNTVCDHSYNADNGTPFGICQLD